MDEFRRGFISKEVLDLRHCNSVLDPAIQRLQFAGHHECQNVGLGWIHEGGPFFPLPVSFINVIPLGFLGRGYGKKKPFDRLKRGKGGGGVEGGDKNSAWWQADLGWGGWISESGDHR